MKSTVMLLPSLVLTMQKSLPSLEHALVVVENRKEQMNKLSQTSEQTMKRKKEKTQQ